MRCGVWELRRRGESEGIFTEEGGLGLVELKIMGMKTIAEIVQCRWYDGAVLGRGDEADIIYHSGTDEGWISVAMSTKNVSKGSDKQEGAQRVSLCDAFKQSISDDIVDVETGGGVSSEVYARVRVIEEAEPGRQERALKETNSFPDIIPEDIVECLFEITRD
jgi:hypothetical protein